MKIHIAAFFLLLLATAVAPLASEPKANPLAAEPLILSPPASAAPTGSWTYVTAYGYMWMPSATTEAEWAPWDPWWAMPYGRWAWASGLGWGWTPLLPPSSMSPLGWGYDSWYGGWYGMADPFGLPCGWYGGPDPWFGVGDNWPVVRPPVWPPSRRAGAGASLTRLGPGRDVVRSKPALLLAVVAVPPRSLAFIRPMREPADRTRMDVRGSGRSDARGTGARSVRGTPTGLHGGRGSGSRVEPWSLPPGHMGGGFSASGSVSGGGKKIK